ncbi:flagellar biosynthetic protein FliO [Hathewaya massiliensis]|uniref:flagellar biosynthetic protein FliO n=1 Tax=Hathewaya massiliensis TaxID=1964382 RepID=UPI00115A4638|nr:flagellar biosynthetic protein FliO [Hathewaya massiliensis]
MNYSTIKMVVQIFMVLPITLLLIYLIVKLGGSKVNSLNKGKIITIIERVQISKEVFLLIAKVMDKYYLMSSSIKGNEILKELDREEIENLLSERAEIQKKYFNNITGKILLKKEEWNEKEK